MRRALALTATLLALAPAAVLAQEPEEELDDEPVPAATAPPPGCERGMGTDADYAYCPDICEIDGADGDYAYADCEYANAGAPERGPKRRAAGPAAAVQPLAATQQPLPMTGQETWLIAGFGAGFLLAGAGLRLRASAADLR